MTDLRLVIPRQPVPGLRAPLADGGIYDLALETPPLSPKVVFYRSLHFQQCNAYLVEVMYVRDKGHQPGYPNMASPIGCWKCGRWRKLPSARNCSITGGFEVASLATVDEAYEKLSANKAEYGIARVQQPFFRGGSDAVYFVDKDTNWWEVEYRTRDITYASLRAKNVQFVEQA